MIEIERLRSTGEVETEIIAGKLSFLRRWSRAATEKLRQIEVLSRRAQRRQKWRSKWRPRGRISGGRDWWGTRNYRSIWRTTSSYWTTIEANGHWMTCFSASSLGTTRPWISGRTYGRTGFNFHIIKLVWQVLVICDFVGDIMNSHLFGFLIFAGLMAMSSTEKTDIGGVLRKLSRFGRASSSFTLVFDRFLFKWLI